MFTIYHADCVGQAGNCLYPHKIDITDHTTLEQAVSHDYVCAEYAGSYRNNANFLGSNCLPVDCDNNHSDDPKDWKDPSDVADAFPGVAFAVHYSRNNMKVKGGKAGEYVRSTTDFYVALESAGCFDRHRMKSGVVISGLRLKSDFMA